VEERAVPQSAVPGEQTYPTQPFPMKPPPLARVSYAPADLVTADDTSPEHAEACRALVEGLGEIRNEGPFTPWAYRAPEAAPVTTLLFPGMVGGPNWGGVAYDAGAEQLLVFSQDVGWLGWVQEAGPGAPLPYDRAGPRPSSFDVSIGGSRWPCQKPPWGRLTAVSATTGDVTWERPVGITEGLPEGRQVTGRPGRAGAIVTASGLVFLGATDDGRFRALDAATGAELWVAELEANANANPLTYLGSDGSQYVAVVAGDQVLAFSLP
jgi:quinoprotein glucose dehydrogenase